ncbi:MAG: hypothetical protein KGZ50_07935 [Peptococcaceae bacterium]|nr:hypothetical protein [Peptococcaceae bacterium]
MFRAVKVGVGIVMVLVLVAAIVVVGIPMVKEHYTWVAVASVNLSAGTRIEGEGQFAMARLKLWPVATVPSGATHTLEHIWGKYLTVNKTRGDIISPADVASVRPKPRVPRRGHYFLGFGVSWETAGNLQIGDVVDVTISFLDRPTITLREDWVVAKIDYENPGARAHGFVEVSLEMPRENAFALVPVISGGFLQVEMVKRDLGRQRHPN